MPPTEALVREFLAAVAETPADAVGVEPVRRRRITAEKSAIAAVMAGCRPEYMPVLGLPTYGPGGNEFEEQTASLPHEKRAEAARNAIAACDAKDVVGAGFFYTTASERFLATSAGLSPTTKSLRSPSRTSRRPAGAAASSRPRAISSCTTLRILPR